MIRTVTEQVIDVSDWDALVEKTYGRPYDFQQQDGCKERQRVKIEIPTDGYDFENDSVPEMINGSEMGVSFAAWLARDPKEWHGTPSYSNFLDLFWGRNFYPSVEMVANDLYEKGLIPAGKYTIDIDW
jgi:hypothetical protein